MSATWNPADKGASITLSGGNLIATKASADEVYALVRATQSRSEGKRYYECRLSAGSGTPQAGIGLALATASLNNYIGGTGSAGYYPDSVYGLNDSFTAFDPGIGWYEVGDYTRVAVDLDSGKIWFGQEDGWNGGDPAAGTGAHLTWPSANPTLYPAAALYRTGEAFAANFGGSAFHYSVPAGFLGWENLPPQGVEIEAPTAALTLAGHPPLVDAVTPWPDPPPPSQEQWPVYYRIPRLCPEDRRRPILKSCRKP